LVTAEAAIKGFVFAGLDVALLKLRQLHELARACAPFAHALSMHSNLAAVTQNKALPLELAHNAELHLGVALETPLLACKFFVAGVAFHIAASAKMVVHARCSAVHTRVELDCVSSAVIVAAIASAWESDLFLRTLIPCVSVVVSQHECAILVVLIDSCR
jgi:hypothetical protein